MSVGRGVWFKKNQVEECLQLDMMQLARDIDLDEPECTNFTWETGPGRESTIGVWVQPERRRMLFTYDVTDRQSKADYFAYWVPFTSTPCYFGGKRWWFYCPNNNCGRRCRILYQAPGSGHFACRVCQKLTYQSQQEGITRAGALIKVLLELPELQHQLYQTRSAKERKRLLKKVARICGSVEWLEKEESES